MLAADSIMSVVPTELRAKASQVAIYGPEARQMLIVTHDDDIYAVAGFELASAVNGGATLVGFTSAPTAAPASVGSVFWQKVDILCGKGICEIAHSGRYVLLRTEKGEIFSYGDASTNAVDEGRPSSSACMSTTCRRRHTGIANQTCSLLSAHPSLQDKKIVQISCGINHAACLTSYGEIYSWGTLKESSSLQNLEQQRPSSAGSTGRGGSPALRLPTATTEIGSNSALSAVVAASAKSVTSSPSKLSLHGCIARRRSPFVEIASYQDIIVALDEDGRVYEWQFDAYHRNADHIVELTSDAGMLSCRLLSSESARDACIVHITAGRSHVLAVSKSFAVYVWGSNDCGQLGLGAPASVTSPTTASPCPMGFQNCSGGVGNFVASPMRVPFFDEPPVGAIKKIKSVTCHSSLDISIAEAVTGDVYVWGDLAVSGFSACTSRPTWTRCRSMAEALAAYGRLSYTPSFVSVPYPNVINALLEAFDNPENADMQFIVVGFPPIYTHRSYLQIRSPQFLTSLTSNNWKQGRMHFISVERIPYNVIRAFLLFLYSNEFPSSATNKADGLDSDDYVYLAELAESCGEILLRKLTTHHLISECLTIENAALLYSTVMACPNLVRENSLPSACLSFILANLVDVVRSESFGSLDGEIAKRILVESTALPKVSQKK